MGAPFLDALLVDDHDLVRILDGGEPVGDDQGGPSLAQFVEGVLDIRLRQWMWARLAASTTSSSVASSRP